MTRSPRRRGTSLLAGLIALIVASITACSGQGSSFSGPSGGGSGGGFVSGRITRREDALAAVSAAADYFQSNEPLSPLGATLREVERRARSSLADLLIELIPDETARADFYWRSGIRPPEQPASDNNEGWE